MYGYSDVKYELQNVFYTDIRRRYIYARRNIEQKVFGIFNISLRNLHRDGEGNRKERYY